ncbi:MAG: hypothetical protein QOE33_474 [Acidobacteriota bacterium]|nr:hypothetical protein [Acidobacteriota bacterium]
MEPVSLLVIAGGAMVVRGIWKRLAGHDKTYTDIPAAASAAVTENFSSDMGWISSLVGKKRLEQQNALLEQITQQINQLALVGEAQTQALTAQYNLVNLPATLMLGSQESLAAFQERIAGHQNTEAVNKAASTMGVSPVTWEQIALMQAQQQVDYNTRLSDLAFTVAQARELKELDVEITDKINRLKLFMVKEKYFMPQTMLKKLNDELSDLYRQAHTLADSSMAEPIRKKEAKRLKVQIRQVEEQIREQAERIRGGLV